MQLSRVRTSEGSALQITRRNFLNRTYAPALLATAFAFADRHGLSIIGPAEAQTAPRPNLMDPGPLPDRILGSATATVTIIEYLSMTCAHCALFATTTFPALKKEFIDTGKVRFIAREFPIDEMAMAAAMLIRSVGQDRYYDALEELFAHWRQWWSDSDRVQPLMAFAIAHLGFTDESFRACLADRQLLDRIAQTKRRAETFGVNSTPAFFINEDIVHGYRTIQQMESLIASHLKA
jgi:protein-disulfide isomerase